jgi:hypothetical protein
MSTQPLPVEQQATIGPLGRMFGIFFSPKATFEDMVRKPDWLLPMAILIVLNTAVCFTINLRTNWHDYIVHQIEKSPRGADMSAEQKNQQAEAGAKYAPIFTYVFGNVIPLVIYLLTALVMWGGYYLLAGVNSSFETAFSITLHAFLVALVSAPLFILVAFLKDPGTLDLDNPLATNLAVVLPNDAAKWLVTLCKQFDIFAIWILILLAIGFATINPKKLKGGKSFTVALSIFAVYVIIRVGIAFISS